MNQTKILAVGKCKEKYLREGIQEYSKRLQAYTHLQIIEAEDEPCPEKASAAEEEKVLQREGEQLLKGISPKEFVILLDLQGQELSSVELATLLANKGLEGRSQLTFVIGGSLGTSQEVRKRADFRWSLSPLTFPHQLVRLVLLEQVYRAHKIIKKEPYHK